MAALTSTQAVLEHNSKDSCWIIVHSKVYDITEFLDGIRSLSPQLTVIKNTLEVAKSTLVLMASGHMNQPTHRMSLPPTFPLRGSKLLFSSVCHDIIRNSSIGTINTNTVVKVNAATEADCRRQALLDARLPLDEILNLHDFEAVAKAILPEKAWAYYSSARDDEIQRIWFRPRILRDVNTVDWSCNILGQSSSLPVYIVCYRSWQAQTS